MIKDLHLMTGMGIALHYFGSESTDANPDDTIGVHEDRRSKINDYFTLPGVQTHGSINC